MCKNRERKKRKRIQSWVGMEGRIESGRIWG